MFESVRLLNTRKKVTVIVLVLTSIALCLVLLHYIRVSSYRPLYTELSSRDASAVTSWLQDRNIDFTTDRVSDLFSHQEALENRLEHRASEIVDALIGPGRSLVKVSVTLDISKSETTAERYNQDNAVVVKEHTEFASGSTYTVPEETDRIRYIPPVPTLSSTDYEVDRIINKTTTAPGSIKRLSVSVLVSGETNHPGDPSPVAHSPGEEEIQIIRKALSSLISIQPERGDTLTVIPVPARPAALEHTGIEASHRLPIDLIIPATKIAILIAGLIFVYMLIIRPLLRFLAADDRKISEKQSLEPDENETVQDEAAAEDVTLVLKKEIVRNPSPTVHIIKNWLQET